MKYVLSVHNKIEFCGKNMDMICRFIYLLTIFICLANVLVGFGSVAVRKSKMMPLK